ncbi:MAG: ThaI family type II restriction endonuclease [bacterium]
MARRLIELFEEPQIVEWIRRKLPQLFQVAEIESSQAGKIGNVISFLFKETGIM